MKFLVASLIFADFEVANAAYTGFGPSRWFVHTGHNPRLPSSLVFNKIASMSGMIRSAALTKAHEGFPAGSSSLENICLDWKRQQKIVLEDEKKGHDPLRFLKFWSIEWRCKPAEQPDAGIMGSAPDVGCKWLNTVRENLGGSFDPEESKPLSISETISYSGLPNEKRITATIIIDKDQRLTTSLSQMFEAFLVEQSRDKPTSRLYNSIRVNQKREVLSISAGGGLDDVYAFSHTNDVTNSIWIVLYVGKTKKLEYGRSLIKAFIADLETQKFKIADQIVISSEDEEKMERDAEKMTEVERVKGMEANAIFALNLLCVD